MTSQNPTLLIAPGERYEVLVEISGSEGDEVALRTLHYDRGHNIPDPGPIEIVGLRLGASGTAPAPLPTTWGQVQPIAFDAATPCAAGTSRKRTCGSSDGRSVE